MQIENSENFSVLLQEIDELKMTVMRLEKNIDTLKRRHGIIERVVLLMCKDSDSIVDMVIEKYKAERKK